MAVESFRAWKIWHLDAELRYRPVAEALPPGEGPVCEVGSGPVGLAAWTSRTVLGIDPGEDEKHGELSSPPNLERLRWSATAIPLEDRSMAAAVAVDMLEHVPATDRGRVVSELKRVTRSGGRVILMGPVGEKSEAADRRLLDRLHRQGIYGGWTVWLEEHLANGLPTLAGIHQALGSERLRSVTVRGVFDLRLWYLMHLVAMEALPRFDPLHALAWSPFAAVARRAHLGPCYRTLVVAELE